MVVDVGAVRHHVKPKADSTLFNMRKADLIKYIRCLENNYNVAVSFNENQARYIESLDAVPVVHARWIHGHDLFYCSLCGCEIGTRDDYNYCPNCGAKMDLKEDNHGKTD